MPELKLQAKVAKSNLVNAVDAGGNILFAQFLDVYPKEKIVDAYFARPKKMTTTQTDGTTKETSVYEPVTELSIGQKTYLVANCANLAGKTIKLKIHEKAEIDGSLKIQTSETDFFKVCKPKKPTDTTYTELPVNDGIETKVDADSNQAVAELIMRPKTQEMASETEAAALSMEGWKEALYHRKDEEPAYVAPTNNRPAHIPLVYNAHKARKSYPKKVTLVEKEVTIGSDAHFECSFKAGANVSDKNNVRWAMYIKDIHDTFTRVKKIKKDTNNKDINDTKEQNAYTLITDRAEISDTDTDFITTPTKADFDSKAYLYARIEVTGGISKMAIQFSKQLEGKKIQIEAFRGNPGLSNTKDYVKTVTLKKPEKAKLLKKLTTNLFVAALCEEGTEIAKLEWVDKQEAVTLQHGGLLFPFRTMPLNHPDSFKNRDYVDWDYTLPDNKGKSPTFGYRRGSNRIHAARDLYYDIGEPIYAIGDGVVRRIAFFYYDTWVIEVEHDFEYIKGHKLIVRYGEVNKNNIAVKVGNKVTRDQKIAEIGLLIPYVYQPEKRGMLHLEMYTGETSGSLSNSSVKYSEMLYAKSIKFNEGRSFKRRKDLFDPLDLLEEMIKNSKKENLIE